MVSRERIILIQIQIPFSNDLAHLNLLSPTLSCQNDGMESFCEQIGSLFDFINQVVIIVAAVVTPVHDLNLKVFVIFIFKNVNFRLFLSSLILLLVERATLASHSYCGAEYV